MRMAYGRTDKLGKGEGELGVKAGGGKKSRDHAKNKKEE